MEIKLYRKDWAWCYDTPDGTMECPPYVRTVGDIESYFEGSGITYVFLDAPLKKMLKGRPKFAPREKERQESMRLPMARSRKAIYCIGQYQKDGRRIAVFLSAKDAAEKNGIKVNTLQRMFSNGSSRSMGFLWARAKSADQLPEKI